MSKRAATRELNHDNWDQDDDEEEEEPGEFQRADEKILQKRVIKQAKRRGVNKGTSGSTGAFSAFSGFGKSTSSAATAFSFLKKAPVETQKPLETSPAQKADTVSESKIPRELSMKPTTKEDVTGLEQYCDEHLEHIKALNRDVLVWLQQHIDKNPYCILTPVFKDYNKHISDLEAKFLDSHSKNSQPPASFGEAFKQASNILSREEAEQDNSEEDKPEDESRSNTEESSRGGPANILEKPSTMPQFVFGAQSAEEEKKSTAKNGTAGFSFGLTPMSTNTAGFSFTGGQPFTFGNVSSGQPAESSTAEETDEPPKNEFKQVTETDAFFTQKCKLFFKKDGEYKEKGVGMLFLKPCDDKTQLIIRADTNLGNLLLNILLNADMPTQRVGKNNVMLVCVPNPPMDEKETPVPTPMLIRVKTSEDADKLLKTIDDKKKNVVNGE